MAGIGFQRGRLHMRDPGLTFCKHGRPKDSHQHLSLPQRQRAGRSRSSQVVRASTGPDRSSELLQVSQCLTGAKIPVAEHSKVDQLSMTESKLQDQTPWEQPSELSVSTRLFGCQLSYFVHTDSIQQKKSCWLNTGLSCLLSIESWSVAELEENSLYAIEYLEQVEAALNQRRDEMAACAAREDYSGAAVARDAAQHLELRFRDLQIQQDNEDRTTVRHRLGEQLSPCC